MKINIIADVKKYSFFLIFIFVSVVWFLGFQTIYEINDNDTYFYIKMAHLYQEKGIFIKSFPWLYHTSWRENFPGIHFLWPVLLMPFVNIFGDLNGAKLLQSLVVGFIFGTLYLTVKLVRPKYSFIFFLLFFTFPLASYFIGRLQNIRAIGLAVLFFMIGLYTILSGKNLLLFITSFFFVWAYDGYIILIILSFFFFISRLIVDKIIDSKSFLISISGSMWGIIINPYFPNNILNTQLIFTNPIINFIFPVSLEWISPYFIDKYLFYILIGYLIILFLGFIFLFQEIRKKPNIPLFRWFFLWLCSIFLVFLTFLSQRFVEYSVLSTFIFLVACFDIFKPQGFNFKKITGLLTLDKNLIYFGKRLLYYFSVIIIMLFVLSIILTLWASQTRFIDQRSFSLFRYYGAANFLKYNSNAGDLVFLDRWDIFPYFFYYNSHNYYVVGLSGNTILRYDPRKFFYYDNLIRVGAICDKYILKCAERLACYNKQDNSLYKLLKEEFGAKFLVVDRYNLKGVQKNYNLDYLIKLSPNLEKIYQDPYFKDIIIYQLR